MHTRRLDDRGGSAVEAALLLAAVAVVMLPALFLLGRAVDSAFSKPCDELPGGACTSSSDPNGASGNDSTPSGAGRNPSAADAARRATRNLERWVAAMVPVPDRGGTPTVVCDELQAATPPPGSTTTCVATYPDGGPSVQYVVEFGPDGNPRLKDA